MYLFTESVPTTQKENWLVDIGFLYLSQRKPAVSDKPSSLPKNAGADFGPPRPDRLDGGSSQHAPVRRGCLKPEGIWWALTSGAIDKTNINVAGLQLATRLAALPHRHLQKFPQLPENRRIETEPTVYTDKRNSTALIYKWENSGGTI